MLDVPEIAIEIVVSSGMLEKLEVYRGLGVLEVWIFERSVLTVYRLAEGTYRASATGHEARPPARRKS